MGYFGGYFGSSGSGGGGGGGSPTLYGSRTGIERIYGTTNVADYADLDDDGDATKISANILAAEAQANGQIAQRFAEVQLTAPTSGTFFDALSYIEDEWAGALLYQSRGMIDTNKKAMGIMEAHWDDAETELARIIAAILYAPAGGPTGPAADPVTLFPSNRVCLPAYGVW